MGLVEKLLRSRIKKKPQTFKWEKLVPFTVRIGPWALSDATADTEEEEKAFPSRDFGLLCPPERSTKDEGK